MKPSQNPKCRSYNPAWFVSSKDKLKENCKVTSVRQPPNPKMAKIKVDQTGIIRREKDDDTQKHMEALKDEYSANFDFNGVGAAAAHHQLWEDWRVREQQDMAAVAQVRGRHAARKQRGQDFLQKKADLAARETREGAKLVERLRAAEIVSRPKLARRSEIEIIDVVGGELMQVHHKKKNEHVPRVERIPLGDLGNIARVEGNNQMASVQQKKVERHKETEEEMGPVFRQESLTQEFNRMMQELDKVGLTGLSDSSLSLLSETPLSPAYLSTILEATEDDGGIVSDDTTALSLALDDVDHEPVRGPSSAEDSANRSAAELSDASTNRSIAQISSDASTNFNARINRQREKENNSEDLDNVRKLVDRIKNQRKIIDERNLLSSGQEEGEETHFKTIEGAAQGEADKNVNREFINKVLNFESNSVLFNSGLKPQVKVNSWTKDSSTSSSTNESTRKTNKKVKKKKKQVVSEPIQSEVNKIKQSENISDSKDSALRGYIEKLLSMRHEDVANLSVSTLSSNKDSLVSTLSSNKDSLVSTLSSNKDSLVSTLTSSLKSSTSTPYSNSHTSDSSGKKQVRFQFDTTQDESSYLGLPTKGSKINSNGSRNSSLLGKSSETNRISSLPVKSTETNNSHLNETTGSVDTVYKQLSWHPGGGGQTNVSTNSSHSWHPGGGQTNVSTNSPDILHPGGGQTNVSTNSPDSLHPGGGQTNVSTNSPDSFHPGGGGQTNVTDSPESFYRELQPQNIPAVKTFRPLSQDDVNLHKSQKEIQSLFRQKRQQLNDQLKRLELEDNSDIETLSEGPLSSSRGSSTSIDLLSSLKELSSIMDRSSLKELSSIVDRRGVKEMSLTDVSSLRGGGSDGMRIEKHRTNGFHKGKERIKDLTEISLRSRKDTGNLLQDFGGNTFSFNLSDDHGDTGDESSKSKISHIDLSSDED